MLYPIMINDRLIYNRTNFSTQATINTLWFINKRL